MANATDVWITSLQGSDPQNLMPYITRQHIYDSRYWKEECFGLNVTSVLDKAAKTLQCIGGTFGPNQQPTKFLCLLLKLLQLQPELELIEVGLIQQEEFKYVRALGCLYYRLMASSTMVAKPSQIYQQLEPLYCDYRKLRVRLPTSWSILHMDEFIHQLLRSPQQPSECFGLSIPRLPLRHVLFQSGYLDEPYRRSALHDILIEFRSRPTNKDGQHNAVTNHKDDEYISVENEKEALLNFLKHKAEVQQVRSAQVLWLKRPECNLVSQPNRNESSDIQGQPHDFASNNQKESLTSRGTRSGNDHISLEDNVKKPRDLTEDDAKQDCRQQSQTQSDLDRKKSPKRNYDNLFKTKHPRPSTTTTTTVATTTTMENLGHADQSSDAYWNEQRAKLGLDPLKKKT